MVRVKGRRGLRTNLFDLSAFADGACSLVAFGGHVLFGCWLWKRAVSGVLYGQRV